MRIHTYKCDYWQCVHVRAHMYMHVPRVTSAVMCVFTCSWMCVYVCMWYACRHARRSTWTRVPKSRGGRRIKRIATSRTKMGFSRAIGPGTHRRVLGKTDVNDLWVTDSAKRDIVHLYTDNQRKRVSVLTAHHPGLCWKWHYALLINRKKSLSKAHHWFLDFDANYNSQCYKIAVKNCSDLVLPRGTLSQTHWSSTVNTWAQTNILFTASATVLTGTCLVYASHRARRVTGVLSSVGRMRSVWNRLGTKRWKKTAESLLGTPSWPRSSRLGEIRSDRLMCKRFML